MKRSNRNVYTRSSLHTRTVIRRPAVSNSRSYIIIRSPQAKRAVGKIYDYSFTPTKISQPKRNERQLKRDERYREQIQKGVKHDCKKEFSKLNSWRSAQGPGRKRSRKELRNNKRAFHQRDC